MRKFSYSKRFFIIALILLTLQGYAQLSKTHYIPPMTDSDGTPTRVADQYMYISTPSEAEVPYRVLIPGTDIVIPFAGVATTVSKDNPVVIQLGRSNGSGNLFINKTQTSVVTTGKGYIVESEAPIYVSIRFNSENDNQAGALVSKGENALGTDFRVGGFNSFFRQRNTYMNFFSVMATEDGTTVTFPGLRPHTNNNFGCCNYEGDDPEGIISNRSATLNKGQSVIIALSAANALIAQQILSIPTNPGEEAKPIVVSCGSMAGSFTGPNQDGIDYGVDQIVGSENIGTEYIFVRGNGVDDYEKVLLIAANGDPNTTVSVNGGPAKPIWDWNGNRNSGRIWNIFGEGLFFNDALHITTSSPVYAYQGIGGNNNKGNKSMFFVPPLSCKARGNVENIPMINKIGDKTFSGSVNIVTQVGANITVTSSESGDLTSSLVGPTQLQIGNTDYVIYKLTDPLPVDEATQILKGNISVTSDKELYCSYFNFNNVASSGSYYAGFPSLPRVQFNNPKPLLGDCIPNTVIEIENPEVFDRYAWYFDDGSGFTEITVADNMLPSYTPESIGTYRVDGIIDCTRGTGDPIILSSAPFELLDCPTDTDSDGVPDSSDIDDDNDGITDAEEPGDTDGDGIIDALDLDSDNDGIYDIVESGRGLADANFDGRSDDIVVGMNGLVDTLEATVDGGIDTATYPLTDSDSDNVFNPFDIDSDNDGILDIIEAFAPNSITLSNTDSNGDGYDDAFDATVTRSDNDSDSIQDYLDLDSDNDGIPDSIEALAPSIVNPTGNDSDGDGLDNAYDINASQVDTDNDGVKDYLDLDSDNDGIFDLIESGSNFPDTDLDGIIDSINIGNNGWHDLAESSPDSGVIGYTIGDADNDGNYNYISLDSDNDGCNDVTEAGFTDNNDNGLLGDTPGPSDVNEKGLAPGDGYANIDDSYIVNEAIAITNHPENIETLEIENITFTIDSNATSFQWQVSMDEGLNWGDIIDDTFYSGSDSNSLSINAVPLDFDTYQFRVILGIDTNICDMSTSNAATLTVVPSTLVYTGFSPNNDGINDTFPLRALKSQYPDFKITIFNRWGRPVYKGNKSTPNWNGKKDNDGDMVPVGVYYYAIEFNKDGRAPEQGELYLSR